MDKVVEEYRDIFSSPTAIPLHCQAKHFIDLTLGMPLPNGPICRRYVVENDEIKRQIQELLQKGHIRPSSSPCTSPIVLVQKKDGTWRLCIDYQALNKITVRNRYPILWIDDILDQLKWPNIPSWEEHLHHIRQVLQTLRQHKLCANLEKCTFSLTQVQYLGYIIDEHGVHVDPSKIQVIYDWPALTTLTELCNFLCLANFYRRCVWGFSHITWPLSQVTKGRTKEKFFWLETKQQAFSELKNHLSYAPVFTLSDLQQPFEIEIDASDYAIGTVLT
eukprot:PITA_09263